MDKFDEYLENKSENEKQEFALPKSFEYKLEETLENLDKEKQEKTNGWYNNKKLWTTAACFAFIFIAGMSVKYGVDFNKSDSIEKSLDNQIARYSADMTKEEGEETGIQIAKEIITKTSDFVDGYYFSFPFNRVHMLEKILNA